MRTAKYACGVVLSACCLVGTAALAEISASDQAAARKTVDQMFGPRIRHVRLTADKSDDLEVAGLLLKASEDSKRNSPVRAELARTAMELSMTVGSTEGVALAEQALDSWTALAGVGKIDRANWLVRIRQAAVSRAAREDRKEATSHLVQAIVELAETYEAAGEMDDAAAQIVRALGLARRAQLDDLVEELDPTNKRIQRVREFRRDLAVLQKQLTAAVAGKNAALVRKTHEKMGLLHLLRNGDPVAATDHLAKAKHEWAGATRSLWRRASKKTLSVAESLAAAEMLREAAQRADIGVRAGMLELLLDLCAELEAKVPGGGQQAVRVELLRNQARAMLAELPNPALQALQRRLRKLAGAVSLNPDGTIRLSYSFDSPKEFGDWTVPVRGRWMVGNKKLIVAKGGGAIHNNVRFRADRPLHVSFAAAGPGGITAVLALNDQTNSPWNGAHLAIGRGGGTGWFMGGLGAGRVSGQLGPNAQPYRVQILHDGVGNFTCVVNGKTLGAFQARSRLVGGSFRLGFVVDPTGGPAAFAKLTIRGTPMAKGTVADPDAKPPAPQPAPAPRRRPGRRRPTAG